jgi:hypothetical protein
MLFTASSPIFLPIAAINALTVDEINAVLEVHKKVGTIEVPAPMWVIKIF